MISLIKCKERKYAVKVHCEEVYNSLLLDDSLSILHEKYIDISNRGIFRYALGQGTVSVINRELAGYNNCEILFDMIGIRDIDNDSLDLFKKLINLLRNNNNTIYIGNISHDIKSSMSSIISLNDYGEDFDIYFGADVRDAEEKCKSFLKDANSAFYEAVVCRIKENTKPYNKVSPSSRVRLSKYVDVKSLMESDFQFFCLAAYMLVQKVWNKDNSMFPFAAKTSEPKREDACLFIHTMNGALLGTLISQLMCLDIVLIDHLGPSNKVYSNDLLQRMDNSREYLVVTDVICMGTELSNAKTILDVFGARYKGCITLVNIIPVIKDDQSSKEDDTGIEALYCVNKNENEIDYHIYTDLGGE